ncbi:hypothetical protein FB45DRAFT_864481 [Roridomyces roridus]|uniref:Uncharacterized protein n=1 Tax=Roridomyces roridus TaxID=1738132 RepID=A0AAD7C157_9AGAR|nr:hypothetical protein FB45DRAFT_864481 [Roridomyces roridus]
MFPPFDDPSQFYPGLILWCDPNCYEMDISTLAPEEPYEYKKARELRPCLVVAVDHAAQSIQVARLCASKPTDPRCWVRIDTNPAITWRLGDAWIWVGTPPTVAMAFDAPKVMHPHKDTKYTKDPIASTNLQHYWMHRKWYIARHASKPSVFQGGVAITGSGYHDQPSPGASGQGPWFNTVSPHPVVVPPGFIETRSDRPGWLDDEKMAKIIRPPPVRKVLGKSKSATLRTCKRKYTDFPEISSGLESREARGRITIGRSLCLAPGAVTGCRGRMSTPFTLVAPGSNCFPLSAPVSFRLRSECGNT